MLWARYDLFYLNNANSKKLNAYFYFTFLMVNKILNFKVNNFIWLFLFRKISRIYKIYFIPTNKTNLPKNNHPLNNLQIFFENQYQAFLNGKLNFNKKIYYILKKNYKKNFRINFLDYGGENLDLYLFLKKNFPKIKITVINQPKLNKCLKDFIKIKKINNIEVLSNLHQAKKGKFNFINFGSSLQYIKNFDKILQFLLKSSKGFIYISATSYFFKNVVNNKIIVRQVNLLPTILYCYVFNFNYIRSLFSKYGYTIIFKKSNSYKKINFNNFSFKINHLDLLFKKN